MSEDELVKAMTERLTQVFQNAREGKTAVTLARECLRQMRYARLCGCLEASECGLHNQFLQVSYKSFDPFDVAVAPEGWEAK